MSYYDFDKHFWSSKQVCCQSKIPNLPKKINRKITRKTVLTGILSIVCVVVWTKVLLNYKVASANNNTYDSDNPCIMFKREPFRIYCSLPQQ